MNEGNPLDWLPEKPPSNKAVLEAWEELFSETIDYLSRTVVHKRVQKLLTRMHPALLNMALLPENSISEWNSNDWDGDERPLFYPPGFDETTEEEPVAEWNPEGEANQGNLMERGEGLLASEKYAVYMSFRDRSVRIRHDIAQEYAFRRLTMHPATALHLIRSISRDSRQTIADALVHKFIKANQGMEKDEEYLDGGFSPDWRDVTNDPTLDVLRFGNIPDLHRRMVRLRKK